MMRLEMTLNRLCDGGDCDASWRFRTNKLLCSLRFFVINFTLLTHCCTGCVRDLGEQVNGSSCGAEI